MKTLITLLLAVFIPAAVHAAGPLLDEPHWSLEIKGGRFTPALSDWAQYYDKRSMPVFEGSLAYKLVRQVDIGISGGYAQAKGHAYEPIHRSSAGEVTYRLAPINLFILLRGVVSEYQWLVPYVGGGFTRLYYQERIENQDSISGSVDGYHFRGGLQFLLDGLDASAANRMYMDYGVYQTYFFIEAQRTHAVVRSVSINLGGTSYQAGFLFEF